MDSTTTREPTPLRPSRGRLSLLFVVVIAAGLAIGTFMSRSGDPLGDTSSPLIDRPAPEVVMDLFDGTQWRLSEHLADDGRPVVLNLWASWCLPCREEIPELDAFATANPGIAVVGVAVNDTPEDARKLFDELQPSYFMGVDATESLRNRYPSVGMPFTVIIDSDGAVRHEIFGALTADRLAGYFD
jgi:thiol-disulfide isomerase/thioredoxin